VILAGDLNLKVNVEQSKAEVIMEELTRTLQLNLTI